MLKRRSFIEWFNDYFTSHPHYKFITIVGSMIGGVTLLLETLHQRSLRSLGERHALELSGKENELSETKSKHEFECLQLNRQVAQHKSDCDKWTQAFTQIERDLRARSSSRKVASDKEHPTDVLVLPLDSIIVRDVDLPDITRELHFEQKFDCYIPHTLPAKVFSSATTSEEILASMVPDRSQQLVPKDALQCDVLLWKRDEPVEVFFEAADKPALVIRPSVALYKIPDGSIAKNFKIFEAQFVNDLTSDVKSLYELAFEEEMNKLFEVAIRAIFTKAVGGRGELHELEPHTSFLFDAIRDRMLLSQRFGRRCKLYRYERSGPVSFCKMQGNVHDFKTGRDVIWDTEMIIIDRKSDFIAITVNLPSFDGRPHDKGWINSFLAQVRVKVDE